MGEIAKMMMGGRKPSEQEQDVTANITYGTYQTIEFPLSKSFPRVVCFYLGYSYDLQANSVDQHCFALDIDCKKKVVNRVLYRQEAGHLMASLPNYLTVSLSGNTIKITSSYQNLTFCGETWKCICIS